MTPLRKCSPSDFVMPGITVGQGDQPHFVAHLDILSHRSAHFLRVVRVGAEHQKSKLIRGLLLLG
jgi:hypothetical protein